MRGDSPAATAAAQQVAYVLKHWHDGLVLAALTAQRVHDFVQHFKLSCRIAHVFLLTGFASRGDNQ